MSYAFISFVNLCVVCKFALSLTNGNGTLINNDLIEMVKKDLRRNNEDYKEMKYANNLTSNNRKVNGSKSRRSNADSSDYNYYEIPQVSPNAVKVVDTSKVMNTVTEILPVMSSKIVKGKLPKTVNKDIIQYIVPLPTTIKPLKIVNKTKKIKTYKNMDIPKFVNTNKIQKFKNFMEKNKGLLKNFLSSKMAVESPQTTTKIVLRQNALDFDKVVNSIVSSSEAKDAGVRHIDELKKMDHIQLPGPELLDLSPARGGRIHKQRVKGRLCQRHVLVPEGPKYDSEGKWYLPAHKLIKNRPYNVTHRPKMLLPRCCNCCKKSVLGCE